MEYKLRYKSHAPDLWASYACRMPFKTPIILQPDSPAAGEALQPGPGENDVVLCTNPIFSPCVVCTAAASNMFLPGGTASNARQAGAGGPIDDVPL